MRVFQINTDGSVDGVPDAYFAYGRARVAAWVAEPSHGDMDQWPQLLDVVANVVGHADADMPMGDDQCQLVDALSDDAIAVVTALAAVGIQLCGGTMPDIRDEYERAGIPVAGACIVSFMAPAPHSPFAMAALARLLESLTPVERCAIVANAAATLSVLKFTPDEVRALTYPSSVDTAP